MVDYSTDTLWIIYKDGKGALHSQHYKDVGDMGILFDPDTGEDMEIVGWSTNSEDPIIQ